LLKKGGPRGIKRMEKKGHKSRKRQKKEKEKMRKREMGNTSILHSVSRREHGKEKGEGKT